MSTRFYISSVYCQNWPCPFSINVIELKISILLLTENSLEIYTEKLTHFNASKANLLTKKLEKIRCISLKLHGIFDKSRFI